jgi:glutamyl/glutaminyl-tRNA synthetase
MNTPSQQAVAKVLGFRQQKYAHMSITISEGGGKLSKRERPKVLKAAIGQRKGDIDLAKLAKAGGISLQEVEEFVADKSVPDMPVIDAMANYMGVALPEINVVDFFKSGYLPETMVNFMGLLGWSTGNERDVMSLDEQIRCFDISRFGKSNSLFDRKKLLAFNTEHMRMVSPDKLLEHFKKYLTEVGSVLCKADDKLLAKMLEICQGARTLAEIEFKCRFLCMANDAIEYDEKAVNKVLLKSDGLAILKMLRDRLAAMSEVSEEKIENMMRLLAEESGIGLGKVAQPLRVALCGGTISPSMFESVQLLGMENTLARIDATLEKFGKEKQN